MSEAPEAWEKWIRPGNAPMRLSNVFLPMNVIGDLLGVGSYERARAESRTPGTTGKQREEGSGQ